MRLTAAVTALASLAVAGMLVSSPASSASPASQRSSLECYAYVHGVSMKGVPATFSYEDGTISTESRGPDGLGFQPRDLAYPHVATTKAAAGFLGRSTVTATNGRRPAPVTSYWFTLAGPQLREVVETDQRDRSGLLVSSSYQTRVVRKNWDGARQISIGKDRDYLYVLTNTDQLLRYRLTGKDGNAVAKLDQVVGVGFAAIGTFEYTRTTTDHAGVRSDVFLATDADSGELIEFSIPQNEPTAYTRTVLQPTGWADMRSVGRMASCLNPTSLRTYDGIVGVDLEGAVRLWTDRSSRDGLGDDIVARGVLKSSWKPMPYSD